MTRLLLRAIDFGASAVFMALCVRAFCVHAELAKRFGVSRTAIRNIGNGRKWRWLAD